MAERGSDSFVIRSGRLIIISNVKFTSESLGYRAGSDEDVRRLREVFETLGFRVFVEPDQSAGHMLQLVNNGLISS